MRTGGTRFRKNKKQNARLNEHTRNKTSKFIFKTDFDMTAIQKEKSEYMLLSKFYTFKSRDARESISYMQLYSGE